ncbi:type I-E CRISPR-associated protein Cse2/CasB [Streptomyces sp. 4N509B]|uniref:type I-E CRISPR-associated protein Cse2/CasB n=1 Tax=Streptomyces sp. 4N509B TaxID=3457413 RepID=UPI003FD59498
MSTNTPTHWGEWFWETFDPSDRYAGRDVAALSRGVGREAGDVPEMWRYYRSIVTQYTPSSRRLGAEHAALALFAVHQQSQPRRMHKEGISLGSAARRLRLSERFSAEAVDRRMHQTATATSTEELVSHLRGLVTLLRGISQPLDYTRLRRDIERWHRADLRTWTRSQWGGDYFDWRATQRTGDADSSALAPDGEP